MKYCIYKGKILLYFLYLLFCLILELTKNFIILFYKFTISKIMIEVSYK